MPLGIDTGESLKEAAQPLMRVRWTVKEGVNWLCPQICYDHQIVTSTKLFLT